MSRGERIFAKLTTSDLIEHLGLSRYAIKRLKKERSLDMEWFVGEVRKRERERILKLI